MCTTRRLCSMKVVGQLGTCRVKGMRSRSSGVSGLSAKASSQQRVVRARRSASSIQDSSGQMRSMSAVVVMAR